MIPALFLLNFQFSEVEIILHKKAAALYTGKLCRADAQCRRMKRLCLSSVRSKKTGRIGQRKPANHKG